MKTTKYRPPHGPARRWHKCKARKKLPPGKRYAAHAACSRQVRRGIAQANAALDRIEAKFQRVMGWRDPR